ncbi:serine/threonine-protein kinase [Nocardia mikamii]|uniref:serine/threonine-protein kinase n=1 Tax=Nocardia mikamii TaxID=508464 RepID=UPI0007A44EA6|nr:serine/threonine-protein kinase [Nocardia mikamii]
MAALAIGETFADYLIEGVLGRGGMGTVYLARHPRLPRRVALKLLDREVCADHERRRRFDQEADIVARLEHPGIVRVYDRGADDGHLWISMHYVHGTDAARLDRRALTTERVLRIVTETAAALDYAHSKAVLHRDIKPANLLLEAPEAGRAERTVLTDFGIARLQDADTELTVTGTLTATLAYASPEQLSGEPLDHRCDQYSLACTLFTLLCGRPPYAGTNPGQVVAGHVTKPIPRPTAVRTDLPPALDPVLARAMAKQPRERYGSCTEFVTHVREALSGTGFGAVSDGYRAPASEDATGADVHVSVPQAGSVPGRPVVTPPIFPDLSSPSWESASQPRQHSAARFAQRYPTSAAAPTQSRAQSAFDAQGSAYRPAQGPPPPSDGGGSGRSPTAARAVPAGAARRKVWIRRGAAAAGVVIVLAGAGVAADRWTGGHSTADGGWGPKYQPIVDNFPQVVSARPGETGWLGTRCAVDPATGDRAAIACENPDRDLRVELVDLEKADAAVEFAADASKHSGDLLARHPGFTDPLDVVLPTPDAAGPQDLYTLFPQDVRRSRFVVGLRWTKHAALEVYDRWWRQLPMGVAPPDAKTPPEAKVEAPDSVPWCYAARTATDVNDDTPGGTGSGPDAVLGYEYAQYATRSGSAARQYVVDEAAAVPSAETLQARIAQVPVGTQHCVHVTGGDIPDRFRVQVFERRPDRGFLYHAYTAITTDRDGRVLIRELRT